MRFNDFFNKLYTNINIRVNPFIESIEKEDDSSYFCFNLNHRNIKEIRLYKDSIDDDYPNKQEFLIVFNSGVWLSLIFNKRLSLDKIYKIIDLVLNEDTYIKNKILRNYKNAQSKYLAGYEKEKVSEDVRDLSIVYVVNKNYELIDTTTLQLFDRIKLF